MARGTVDVLLELLLLIVGPVDILDAGLFAVILAICRSFVFREVREPYDDGARAGSRRRLSLS